MSKIVKVVFPCAGLGSRLLPLTRSIPKEMLLLHGRPVITYAIDEAVNSGAEELIFIINQHKENLIQYIKKYVDLLRQGRSNLGQANNSNILEKEIKIHFIEQLTPRGLGDAILQAEGAVDGEVFAVMLPDEVFFTNKTTRDTHLLSEMVKIYYKASHIKPRIDNLISVFHVKKFEAHNYGIVEIVENNKIKSMIEKPTKDQILEDMPLSILGRYILTPKIFTYLKKQSSIKNSQSKELDLTSSMSDMIISPNEGDFFAFLCNGERIDCGNLDTIRKANVY